MLSLQLALFLFVLYFLASFAYYRLYCRHRLYLVLLGEASYMEHYISRLPHMRERPEERRDMEAFLLAKRGRFLRCVRNFVFVATALYVGALILAADAV